MAHDSPLSSTNFSATISISRGCESYLLRVGQNVPALLKQMRILLTMMPDRAPGLWGWRGAGPGGDLWWQLPQRKKWPGTPLAGKLSGAEGGLWGKWMAQGRSPYPTPEEASLALAIFPGFTCGPAQSRLETWHDVFVSGTGGAAMQGYRTTSVDGRSMYPTCFRLPLGRSTAALIARIGEDPDGRLLK
jgi:hypothetical protein